MTLNTLIRSIEIHRKLFPDEKTFCDATVSWIHEYEDFAFVKENLLGHITGSLLITNTEKTKVLLMFHKKLQLWLQFGGHADGETDVERVAIREFHEESGIALEPFVFPEIFDIHVHDIPEYRGVGEHKHFDILYLGTIPEDTLFTRQESEVDDIRWFEIEGIEKYIAEVRMLDMMKKIKHLSEGKTFI